MLTLSSPDRHKMESNENAEEVKLIAMKRKMQESKQNLNKGTEKCVHLFCPSLNSIVELPLASMAKVSGGANPTQLSGSFREAIGTTTIVKFVHDNWST